MKNEELPYNALTMGYVLIPKLFLMNSLDQKENEFSYHEAFLALITRVNYKDTIVNVRGTDIMCCRDESLMSTPKWAEIFHWTVGKTRRFFEKMEKDGKIKIVPVNYWIRRVQVVDYDLWTSSGPKKWDEGKTRSEELFHQFWNKYHSTTQTRKTDIGSARREWKRLSKKERELAISQIEMYCMGLNDMRFVKQAGNYLKDKSF